MIVNYDRESKNAVITALNRGTRCGTVTTMRVELANGATAPPLGAVSARCTNQFHELAYVSGAPPRALSEVAPAPTPAQPARSLETLLRSAHARLQLAPPKMLPLGATAFEASIVCAIAHVQPPTANCANSKLLLTAAIRTPSWLMTCPEPYRIVFWTNANVLAHGTPRVIALRNVFFTYKVNTWGGGPGRIPTTEHVFEAKCFKGFGSHTIA